jgi:hypothetical protein
LKSKLRLTNGESGGRFPGCSACPEIGSRRVASLKGRADDRPWRFETAFQAGGGKTSFRPESDFPLTHAARL